MNKRGSTSPVSRANNIFETDLGPTPANHQPQTPLSFLTWAASVYPDQPAAIHGARTIPYGDMLTRCRRLAGALAARGIGRGDAVSVMGANTPELLEAHFGIAMAGAVLNALNTRLDAPTIAFILDHAESKLLITDREYAPVIKDALARLGRKIPVIDIDDPETEAQGGTRGEHLGEMDYEAFLKTGDPEFPVRPPEDEWQAISLNYTSGTTGNPKGVVYHHRGAFVTAMGGALVSRLDRRSRYLWTLPMFHCNGWSYPWSITAAAGTHICLRRVDPALIFPMIAAHRVTHMCGAPIVLNMLIHAPDAVKTAFEQKVEVFTGGAAPPSAVISGMEQMGFRVTHLYGLTESYGPSTYCAWQDDWDDLDPDAQAQKISRAGVRYPSVFDQTVMNPETMEPVPADGQTMGEIMLRGNTIMKGYLKNPTATEAAFRGGWFHTGDLAVLHPDGYVEIKDRSKDVIISGGENISSLEVEECLYRHPDVMEAAVVAQSDDKWGETPCAFVTLKPGAEDRIDTAAIIEWCRTNMAHYKAPRHVVFGPLPKTSTGKIQKFVLRDRANDTDQETKS
ncbi:MAG: acyl-CoA synthetase [Rhodospirillaceae bacterium]|nr:acyl-CoA synthetase [Magnetovibrio sp.]MAY68838.1 acyl-CoA synthetase [Rhodospirillaceae bacterium]